MRPPIRLGYLFLLLVAPLVAFALEEFPLATAAEALADNNGNNNNAVPPYATLTLSQLLQGSSSSSKDDAFAKALQTTGLIAIVNDEDNEDNNDNDTDSNANNLSRRALAAWCTCAEQQLMSQQHAPSTQIIGLADGVTTRTTLATATIGTNHALALDAAVCGAEATDVLEDLRDDVDQVAQAFVQAADRVLSLSRQQQQQAPLLTDTYGKAYHSLASIVQAATHLEHYHVYDKQQQQQQNANSNNNNNNNNMTLDFHTDAGLFLTFVPAHDCDGIHNNNANDASFFVRTTTNNGTVHAVTFPPNTRAVIMLGAGAQQWLRQQHHDDAVPRLAATVHAVRMPDGQSRRAWYGKMHLVPDNAIVQTVPTTKTFSQLKQSITTASIALAQRQHNNDAVHRLTSPSLGCGDVPVPNDPKLALLQQTTTQSTTPARRRRRLQHVGSPDECNNVTNFFCWYQCLDIPNAESLQGYVNEGYSLYCLDPAVLASSGNQVSVATEPCQEGYVHNGACQGSWQPTAPGVPTTANFDYLQSEGGNGLDDFELQYCYGGVSMYMDGFHWVHDSLCVIYLFPGWVLSSRAKLVWASVATIWVGILLEGIIWQRRRVATHMPAGVARLGVGSLMYGIQLTVGYFLMLVIMTYSGVLFVCTVVGLMLGQVVFNPKDGLLHRAQRKYRRTPTTSGSNNGVGDDELPALACPCADDKTTGVAIGSANDSSVDGDDDHRNNGVPDGATPCCQYVA